MTQVTAIHHASVIVADVGRSLAFYVGVLGLDPDPARPDLGYNGAWLNLVGGQQLHLLELPNPDPVSERPEHVGRDRHTAFSVTGLEVIVTRLEAAGIAYTKSRSGRNAAFCRDPDGNGIELIEAPVFPVI